jgi:ABC-type multidrug transport system fused ATPase/permease subunit
MYYNNNNNNNRPPRHQYAQVGGALALPDPVQLPALVVRTARQVARRHPYVTGSYLLGLVLLMFIGNGTRLTLQQQREYNSLLNKIDLQKEFDAAQDYYRNKQVYMQAKGWFSCDANCQRYKARMNKSHERLASVRLEGQAYTRLAKQKVGVLSEVGIGEVKDSFWEYFTQGKQFAKRQSMWDVMFMGMRSMTRGRDESWVEFGLKILLQVLMNLSVGLIMALVMFVIGLWSIVSSYQANPLVSILVFLGAACAAFSFVMTYLLAVYGAAATGVYGMVKLAETSARQAIAQEQRRQYMTHRPHND